MPYLCGYEGRALFMDADMLVRDDIWRILDHADDDAAVQVVKVKEQFEWPALMLFNNEKCNALTPEAVENGEPFRMDWGKVGDLPKQYHHIVGYHEPMPDASIVHFTMGIPDFPEVRPCEFQDEWIREKNMALGNCSWIELMGRSVHANRVMRKFA